MILILLAVPLSVPIIIKMHRTFLFSICFYRIIHINM